MEKYSDTDMAERIIINKHFDNSSDITYDKFKSYGEIVISNEPGFEGIYVVNTNGQVVKIGGGGGSIPVGDDVIEFLRTYYMTSAQTVSFVNATKESLSALTHAVRFELLAHESGSTERFESIENRVEALENAPAPSAATVDEEVVRQISAEEIAKVVASADTRFDTLKEIADWIINDETGSAQMANDIAEAKSGLETLSSSTESLSASTEAICAYTNTLKDYVDEKFKDVTKSSDHIFLSRPQYNYLIENGVVMLEDGPHYYSDDYYYCIYEGDDTPSGWTGSSYSYDEETGLIVFEDGASVEDGFLNVDGEVDEHGFLIINSSSGPSEPTIEDGMLQVSSISDDGFIELPLGSLIF